MSAVGMTSPATGGVRWSWLWGRKLDIVWNFLPFWLGFILLAVVFATRTHGVADDPHWSVQFAGHGFDIVMVAFILYGAIVDGPHLWATIARTYTDPEEWETRRSLFITSLLAFAIGPIAVLAPYVVNLVTPLPAENLDWGWKGYLFLSGLYALFHINRQHWGFVSLYKRKNEDNDPAEQRVDSVFFHTAIWMPYVAMAFAPWAGLAARSPVAARGLYGATHIALLTACAGYALYQLVKWRKGAVRNGPKLLYIATVLTLYYLTFAWDPRIAFFWVFITSTGHCAQYHGVVWAYGKKRYAQTDQAQRSLPQLIFNNVWLYATLGVLFALITMQGPGANAFKMAGSEMLQSTVFTHVFAFLNATEGQALGFKVLTAFIGGVRLHHFYVDSKIWRVSKSKTLARSLNI